MAFNSDNYRKTRIQNMDRSGLAESGRSILVSDDIINMGIKRNADEAVMNNDWAISFDCSHMERATKELEEMARQDEAEIEIVREMVDQCKKQLFSMSNELTTETDTIEDFIKALARVKQISYATGSTCKEIHGANIIMVMIVNHVNQESEIVANAQFECTKLHASLSQMASDLRRTLDCVESVKPGRREPCAYMSALYEPHPYRVVGSEIQRKSVINRSATIDRYISHAKTVMISCRSLIESVSAQRHSLRNNIRSKKRLIECDLMNTISQINTNLASLQENMNEVIKERCRIEEEIERSLSNQASHRLAVDGLYNSSKRAWLHSIPDRPNIRNRSCQLKNEIGKLSLERMKIAESELRQALWKCKLGQDEMQRAVDEQNGTLKKLERIIRQRECLKDLLDMYERSTALVNNIDVVINSY